MPKANVKPTMSRRHWSAVVTFAGLFLLNSCQPLNLPLPDGAADWAMVKRVDQSGSFRYTLQTAKPNQDVWLVFSNTDTRYPINTDSISFASKSIMVDGRAIKMPQPPAFPRSFDRPGNADEQRAAWNRDLFAMAKLSPRNQSGPLSAWVYSPAGSDVVGAAGTLSVDVEGDRLANGSPAPSIGVAAHCRLFNTVQFADGRKRSLSIWVQDSNWNASGFGGIDQNMVDALGSRFLSASENANDIYHLDTALLGEPWGTIPDEQLIAWDANNTITILLANLNASYAANSFVAGYFWNKDNLVNTGYPDTPSNQRLMFYIDASLYSTIDAAHGETSWQATNIWPEEIYSTLAHEFQHMIQFYQKGVLARGDGQSADTWINEMCSLLAEDLLADKMGVLGPRGVAPSDGSAGSAHNFSGRPPVFNYWNDKPWYTDSAWTGNMAYVPYSAAYMLGAWIIRNFGGAETLRKIVHGPQVDESAILQAIAGQPAAPATFKELLAQWAVAVLLSDRTDAPWGLRYNVGNWFPASSTTIAPSTSFRLGSINAFNYDFRDGNGQVYSGPYWYADVAEAEQSSRYFYQGASIYLKTTTDSTGSRTMDITLPADVVLNVVVK